MKLEYTEINSVGVMTLEEAIQYIEEMEKDFCRTESTLHIQGSVIGDKGLLVYNHSNEYHFLQLKENPLTSR